MIANNMQKEIPIHLSGYCNISSMDTFQALAEPTRRRIIEMIAVHGQLSASDISDLFKVTPPAISQHLKVLREAKLVDMEKRAQSRIYTISPAKLTEIEAWIQKLKKV
jgi:DNA-binding transcriptional ArsR family regulator